MGAFTLLANAGTPLMWAAAFHLLFGNALIALLEFAVIWHFFRIKNWWILLAALIANYTSALAGWFVLYPLAETFGPAILGIPPLFGVMRFMVVLIAAAFVLTFLVELPIYGIAMRRARRGVLGIAVAVLGAQVASYAMLVSYYLSASGYSVPSYARLELTADFARNTDADVYFIVPEEHAVYHMMLGQRSPKKVAETGELSWDSRLMAAPSEDASRAVLQMVRSYQGDWTTLNHDLGPLQGVQIGEPTLRDAAIDLRPTISPTWEPSRWIVQTSGWSGYGLMASRVSDQSYRRIAVELPFLEWPARCATVLPGDQVIFELGPQIVLYDLNTQQLAVLAMGRAPAALLRRSPATSSFPASR